MLSWHQPTTRSNNASCYLQHTFVVRSAAIHLCGENRVYGPQLHFESRYEAMRLPQVDTSQACIATPVEAHLLKTFNISVVTIGYPVDVHSVRYARTRTLPTNRRPEPAGAIRTFRPVLILCIGPIFTCFFLRFSGWAWNANGVCQRDCGSTMTWDFDRRQCVCIE